MQRRGIRICLPRTHGRQRRLVISHHHAEAEWAERACRNIAAFLHGLRLTAEQLTQPQRWCRILSRALAKYLHGRQLQPPAPSSPPAHHLGPANATADGPNCSF
jgi:hypothetical protein